MGEMADYMLNGDDCECCGQYLGEGMGFPRTCVECGGDWELYDFEDNPDELIDVDKSDAEEDS